MPPYGFLQLVRWPLLLVTLVLHVVSIASVPVFVVLLRKNRAKLMVAFGVFLVVAGVILTVESVDHGVVHVYDFATGERSSRSLVD